MILIFTPRYPFAAMSVMASVTRLGDLLDFLDLLAYFNNYFAKISYILRQLL